MKYLLKTISVICCICFVAGKTNAQPHAGIFIHALYAAPVGSISNDFYTSGIGAEGGILTGRKTTRLAGTIGYSRFFNTGINIYGDKTYIPIKAGVRQYLPLTLNFLFLQADAGIGLVSYKHTAESETPFAYDFNAGVKFAGFEALIGWDTFHSNLQSGWSSWFTVKAGIDFGF